MPNVNVTYGEMQAAARQLQVPVIRLRAAIAVTAAVMVALSCVLSGTAMASTATAYVRPMPVTTGASAWYVASVPVIAAVPGCGKGANVRRVVATYKARKYQAVGIARTRCTAGTAATAIVTWNRTSGSTSGLASFTFAMAQTLKAPASVVAQPNGNYMESAPIYQCFYAGYYVIWTFFVIPEISSGTIVTAYGREGKRVHESCP